MEAKGLRQQLELKDVSLMIGTIWKSEKDATKFLDAPHPMLGGKTPREVTKTKPERVVRLLWSLYFGLLG